VQIHVEFLGDARLSTGLKAFDLEIVDDASFRDVVRLLSTMHPSLVGDVIHPSGDALQGPNIINCNGRRMIQEEALDEPVSEGDRLTFMSILAGG
jgi:molybdopterin converting factor small subunit